MPNFRKVQIDVESQPGTARSTRFRIYVRPVPESNSAENWTGYTMLGTTTRDNIFVWERAIAGQTYEFRIVAVDDRNSPIQDEDPLVKRFAVNPDPPTSISGINVELDE